MKTLQTILEIAVAVPVGLLSVPLLIIAMMIKVFMPARVAQGVLIKMDNRQELKRYVG